MLIEIWLELSMLLVSLAEVEDYHNEKNEKLLYSWSFHHFKTEFENFQENFALMVSIFQQDETKIFSLPSYEQKKKKMFLHI